VKGVTSSCTSAAFHVNQYLTKTVIRKGSYCISTWKVNQHPCILSSLSVQITTCSNQQAVECKSQHVLIINLSQASIRVYILTRKYAISIASKLLHEFIWNYT
jgi:hypothetical protein